MSNQVTVPFPVAATVVAPVAPQKPFPFPKAADFDLGKKVSAPLLPLSQVIASQGAIDTSKNAPVVKGPSKGASNSSAKPSAKKAVGAYHGLNYIVRGDGATKLFAHTAAWLELTGLIHGKAAPVALVKELGGSALNYHMKQGNFEINGNGQAKLTAKGLAKFKARQHGGHGAYDAVDMEHYMLMMLSGVNDERLVKNAGSIRALA